MDKPWKVIFAFIGVFIAGTVFGGLFTLSASAKRAVAETAETAKTLPPEVVVTTGPATPGSTRPEKEKNRPPKENGIVPALMRRFTERLNPTTEQRQKIRLAVDRAAADLQRTQREHLQETERVTARMYEDVSAVLTQEQRVQLETIKQETLERTRKERERLRMESQWKGAAKAPPTGPPIQARQPGS